MSRILLTGASGLVGAHLSAALAGTHELFGIYRNAPAAAGCVKPVQVNLGRDWSTEVLPHRIDAVIHLAQSDRWQDFPGGALDVFAVNVASTARLLDYATRAGATQFVMASTGGLYGSVPEPIREEMPVRLAPGPLQYYFETKRAAEGLALSYGGHFAVSVLRPFFIYGRGQRQPKLVARLIDRVRNNAVITLRGQSGTQMNPIHVDDVVAVIQACLARQHCGIVNLGGGQVTSIRSMVDRIAEVLRVAVNLEPEDGDAECFVADVTRMSALMGRPPIRFDDGIVGVLQDDSRL